MITEHSDRGRAMESTDSQMHSTLREDKEDDEQAATKGDVRNVMDWFTSFVNRQPPASATQGAAQLDHEPKYMKKLLEKMKQMQAFQFADPKIAANQLYALAKLRPDVYKEIIQYLTLVTIRKKETVTAEKLVTFVLMPKGPFDQSITDCNEAKSRIPAILKFG
jgi:hypothetical protein